ncbi:MAG TPA: DUF1592 domain-containing protein [Chthoniobacter sp.]|nr:DUF1592 domain-containing protein [Chthoniobacter sp.]
MKTATAIASVSLLALLRGATHAATADFEKEIRPILAEYCNKCHSTEKQKGDLDLERFGSLTEVKKHPDAWADVLEQLANKEMPPKEKPQLSTEQKQQLIAWAQGTLDEIALASAGDPGPVVLRRLSNSEYLYTLRDLTGVPTLDPTKEFPIDGAAGEGFDNAGAALVMSPSLLGKYFEAAREIAGHAVLVPDGIRFSAATSSRDWTDEILANIRAFYARFSEDGGATAMNLQEVKIETNAGGRLPVQRYITVLLENRDALRSGTAAIGDVAQANNVNAKYLGLLWLGLTDSQSSLLLDGIREKFRTGAPADAAAITQQIQGWQQYVWRFFSVGHIGKKNRTEGWQQAWTPLASHHELRLKLPPSADGKDISLYLVANHAGTGSEQDLARWENARLVVKNHPDTLLRDVPDALPAELQVSAPAVLEVKIPAALAKDAEFVVDARLADGSAPDAGVQVRVLTAKPDSIPVFSAGETTTATAKGLWSDNNARTTSSAPILVQDGSPMRQQLEKAFADFRALFPIALCYTKIVPTDEVVTLTLFYREDEQLKRLMLDDAQGAALDRLWEELRFVSEAPLKQVDVFEQLYQFATQDADPSAFEPMREPIKKAAAAFKQEQVAAEPKQLQAVLDLAQRAWRRPLTDGELAGLRGLYQKLRAQELSHDAALRMTLTRVLVSSAFLYRGELATVGAEPAPVNDWELATRLSYFLWSSAPDAELRSLATAGRLHDPEILAAQTRRMLKDSRVRRLATEFGCQWLHVRDVATLDEKSERHFPTFASLRGDMQEEVVRFFMDLFQEDRSVLSLLDADYTFVNGPLAQHYGISTQGADWQRVDGLRAQGRGGILGFAATLAKQSGASRTSPILRGNWLSEVVLGDKLPRPPKGVPILPDEAPAGLTERQLIERHSSDEKCAKCHQRIDPFGFALEGFDAIGRARRKDAAGLDIDTQARLADGTTFAGLEGLRAHLLDRRRDDFLRQFCRKLVGYSLGRGVQLSDKPLIDSMIARLKDDDFHVGDAIELIVRSPQFRQVRGRDFLTNN